MGKWKGNNYYLGKVRVGYVRHDGIVPLTPLTDKKKWYSAFLLPGISGTMGDKKYAYFETQQEAVANIESVVALWVANANLEIGR